MLKRKFSLGLKDRLLSKNSNIPVDVDPEFSPPPSPYPGKRDALPQSIEVDLRSACASIVNNLIPSDYDVGPTDDIKPQLDFAAIKSSFPAVPPSINGRRATVSQVPDFPLPIPLHNKNKSPYTYKPDPTLRSLFPDPDPANHPAHSSRQRAENLFIADGPLAGRKFTRPLSQNFSLNSNVPSIDVFPRPWQVQRGLSHSTEKSTPGTDTAEYPWNASTAATSLGVTPGHSKHTSTQNETATDQARQVSITSGQAVRQISVPSTQPVRQASVSAAQRQGSMASDRGRSQQVRHVQSSTSIANPPKPVSRSQSRARSRARSITNSIKDYIRPGSSQGREPSVGAPVLRAPSVHAPSVRAPSVNASRPVTRSKSKSSIRSKESSNGAGPERNKFSWKSWRNSWQPWKASDSGITPGEDPDRARADKRGSDGELNAESSVNLNRELPPLPGLDQWKDQEPAKEPEKEKEPEKTKHIATLLKRRSGDFTKRISGDFSKFKHELNKRRSQDMSKWKMDWRKSREFFDPPVFETPQSFEPVDNAVAEASESPSVQIPSMTPATAAPSGSPRHSRRPAPKTQSTPTDSVMGDQERNASTGKSAVEVRMPSGYDNTVQALGPLTSSPLTSSQMEKMVVPISTSKSPTQPSENIAFGKRRPSRLELGRHTSPRLYDREFNRDNGATNFVSTDVEVENYDRAKAVSNKYLYADDISSLHTPPPVPPKDKSLKWLRKSKSKKQMTWMDEMEKLGVKDGLLLTDNLQGSPIVRY